MANPRPNRAFGPAEAYNKLRKIVFGADKAKAVANAVFAAQPRNTPEETRIAQARAKAAGERAGWPVFRVSRVNTSKQEGMRRETVNLNPLVPGMTSAELWAELHAVGIDQIQLWSNVGAWTPGSEIQGTLIVATESTREKSTKSVEVSLTDPEKSGDLVPRVNREPGIRDVETGIMLPGDVILDADGKETLLHRVTISFVGAVSAYHNKPLEERVVESETPLSNVA